MPKKHTKTDAMLTSLIAPCGMNCRLCVAYMRDRNPCPGCRGDDSLKPKTRVECRIRNCEKVARARAKYCFECESFPCARLTHLDTRYRTRYGMSMIDNLKNITKFGVRNFVNSEREKWTCPACGGTICVHKENCISCGYKWR